MSPDQQHRCFVERQADGKPYLAFAPSSGRASSYSNSLFTLDLRHETSVADAEDLAEHINRMLQGVSATVF